MDIHPNFVRVPKVMDVGTQWDHVIEATYLIIARVLVAAAIVCAAVCAGCRPSVGHPLIRIRSADKRLRKY